MSPPGDLAERRSFVAASCVALCLLLVEKDFARSFRDETPSSKQTATFCSVSTFWGLLCDATMYWDEVLGLPAVAGGCHS